jgi:hypothetical protein
MLAGYKCFPSCSCACAINYTIICTCSRTQFSHLLQWFIGDCVAHMHTCSYVTVTEAPLLRTPARLPHLTHAASTCI